MSRHFILASVLVAVVFGPISTSLAQSATEKQPKAEQTYIRWLEERSMLFQGAEQAKLISGQGVQWQHAYGDPQPREAVKRASVWLLDYPGSVITRPRESVIGTWGNPELWKALEQIGVDLLHTGPVKQAGSIHERRFEPSVDGWFDPISIDLDPDLGTDKEYREMVRIAEKHGGYIQYSTQRNRGATFSVILPKEPKRDEGSNPPDRR